MTCIILQNSRKKFFVKNRNNSKGYTLKKYRFSAKKFFSNFKVLYMLLYRFWLADFKYVDKNQIWAPVQKLRLFFSKILKILKLWEAISRERFEIQTCGLKISTFLVIFYIKNILSTKSKIQHFWVVFHASILNLS